jgi:hypothetical protein
MRKLTLFALLAAVMIAPQAARAGFVLEASLGRGMQVAPEFKPEIGRTNLLLAPGYGLGEVLRAEIGFVFDVPDGTNPDLNLRVRPMLVIDPPVLPLYGRVIVGMANVLDDTRAFEFGGAIGAGAELGGVGIYAELGVLPQASDDDFLWLLEGRAGVYISFD